MGGGLQKEIKYFVCLPWWPIQNTWRRRPAGLWDFWRPFRKCLEVSGVFATFASWSPLSPSLMNFPGLAVDFSRLGPVWVKSLTRSLFYFWGFWSWSSPKQKGSHMKANWNNVFFGFSRSHSIVSHFFQINAIELSNDMQWKSKVWILIKNEIYCVLFYVWSASRNLSKHFV